MPSKSSSGTAQRGGILYPATSTGKGYLATDKHRKRRQRNRSAKPSKADQPACWCISRDAEYNLFCHSDSVPWVDDSGNLWGILKNRQRLGIRKETIAKFPKPQNISDPWHGYPASPARFPDEDTPDDSVIKLWERDSYITPDEGIRLARRKHK